MGRRPLNTDLEKRLALFEESGQVSAEVVSFTRDELERVAEEWGLVLEEENAGMLVSHLLLALERARAGEAIADWEGSEDAAEELAARPRAVEKAQRIVSNAQSTLGANLPEGEARFLALHLAAIAEVQDIALKERRGENG